MYDIVAMGELLIDFTPNGRSENGHILFEQNPGGAPANFLSMLSNLGLKTSFIGKVGNDQFGTFLRDSLRKSNVNTDGLVFGDDVNTSLAFVHLHSDGERSFSFYRGADLAIQKNEVAYNIIENSKLFHFGSISLTNNPAREATLQAVNFAKSKKKIISYDPNYRQSLWDDRLSAKKQIEKGLYYTDILKLSEEEHYLLTETNEFKEGTNLLYEKYGINLIFVTLGNRGCFFRFHDETGVVPSYQVNVVDTTAAGDSFFGSIIYKIIKHSESLNDLNSASLVEYIRFANAAGALTTTKKGGIPALPKLKEINRLDGQMKFPSR